MGGRRSGRGNWPGGRIQRAAAESARDREKGGERRTERAEQIGGEIRGERRGEGNKPSRPRLARRSEARARDGGLPSGGGAGVSVYK